MLLVLMLLALTKWAFSLAIALEWGNVCLAYPLPYGRGSVDNNSVDNNLPIQRPPKLSRTLVNRVFEFPLATKLAGGYSTGLTACGESRPG